MPSLVNGLLDDIAGLSVLSRVAVQVAYRVQTATPSASLAQGRGYLYDAVVTLKSAQEAMPREERTNLSAEIDKCVELSANACHSRQRLIL